MSMARQTERKKSRKEHFNRFNCESLELWYAYLDLWVQIPVWWSTHIELFAYWMCVLGQFFFIDNFFYYYDYHY